MIFRLLLLLLFFLFVLRRGRRGLGSFCLIFFLEEGRDNRLLTPENQGVGFESCE
jgi:hypothetical protein